MPECIHLQFCKWLQSIQDLFYLEGAEEAIEWFLKLEEIEVQSLVGEQAKQRSAQNFHICIFGDEPSIGDSILDLGQKFFIFAC